MIKRLTLLSIIVMLAACTASINTTSKVSYSQDSFTEKSLDEGGLALLPITAGTGLEGYRRPFGDALNSSSDSLKPFLDYIGWQESLNKLNDKGLATEYNEAMRSYRETSIIDKEFLQIMGEALGQRYFLYVQLGNFESDTNTSYNIFTGFETTKTNEVNAYAQVWDAAKGDVVWEAVSSAEASSSSSLVKVSDNPQKYGKELAEGIASKLYVFQ